MMQLSRFAAMLAAALALTAGHAVDAASPWSHPDANVLLVGFDAVRMRSMSLYGHSRPTTPRLEAFARRAIVFHQAISPAAWTLPATMSVFTGLWPSLHGVINKNLLLGNKMVPSRLNPAIETFPQVLARHGYTLGAFTGDAGVKASFGYGAGFDTYLDDLRFGGFDHSVPPALDWLEKHKSRKFFVFLHGYDAHGQYDPPAGYSRRYAPGYKGPMKGGKQEQGRLREAGLDVRRLGAVTDRPSLPDVKPADFAFHEALYDEKIEDADKRFGDFLDRFEKMGLLEKTIVVVFADHGEEFGEHGYIDHGPTLYDEMVRVPLLIRFPGQKTRVDVRDQVRTLDAFPTVLDALGIRTEKIANGVSLLPAIRGEKLDLPAFSETDYRHITHKRSIRTPRHKLIVTLETGARELYDLEKDPLEKTNIAESAGPVAYELEQRLFEWMSKTNQHPDSFRDRIEPFIMEY